MLLFDAALEETCDFFLESRHACSRMLRYTRYTGVEHFLANVFLIGGDELIIPNIVGIPFIFFDIFRSIPPVGYGILHRVRSVQFFPN